MFSIIIYCPLCLNLFENHVFLHFKNSLLQKVKLKRIHFAQAKRFPSKLFKSPLWHQWIAVFTSSCKHNFWSDKVDYTGLQNNLMIYSMTYYMNPLPRVKSSGCKGRLSTVYGIHTYMNWSCYCAECTPLWIIIILKHFMSY